jgi:uncharacterized protein YaiE (UPF0345 family)
MADFDDHDIEIQDEKDSSPEHFNGNVASAGTPVTLTPTSAKPVQLAFIHCNSVRDPSNANAIGDAIKFSLDGGVSWTTLMSGESICVPGIYANLKLDTNENGTYYEVILWS